MPELWADEIIEESKKQNEEANRSMVLIPFLLIGVSGFVAGMLFTMAVMLSCGR